MTEKEERMGATITKADSECMARGIVALAPQIRAWLDTPEQQARYKVWLAERARRQEASKTKEAADSSHPASSPETEVGRSPTRTSDY